MLLLPTHHTRDTDSAAETDNQFSTRRHIVMVSSQSHKTPHVKEEHKTPARSNQLIRQLKHARLNTKLKHGYRATERHSSSDASL